LLGNSTDFCDFHTALDQDDTSTQLSTSNSGQGLPSLSSDASSIYPASVVSDSESGHDVHKNIDALNNQLGEIQTIADMGRGMCCAFPHPEKYEDDEKRDIFDDGLEGDEDCPSDDDETDVTQEAEECDIPKQRVWNVPQDQDPDEMDCEYDYLTAPEDQKMSTGSQDVLMRTDPSDAPASPYYGPPKSFEELQAERYQAMSQGAMSQFSSMSLCNSGKFHCSPSWWMGY